VRLLHLISHIFGMSASICVLFDTLQCCILLNTSLSAVLCKMSPPLSLLQTKCCILKPSFFLTFWKNRVKRHHYSLKDVYIWCVRRSTARRIRNDDIHWLLRDFLPHLAAYQNVKQERFSVVQPSIVFARWRQCFLPWGHIGATWRIRLNLCILQPTWVHNPNGKSIGSAVYAEMTSIFASSTACLMQSQNPTRHWLHIRP